MEPIPETVVAIEGLGALGTEDVDLLADLRERSLRVREIVPDCVGMSLASREHGLTFTLVASDLDAAVLDAVQYLFGGPCVDLVEEQKPHATGFEHEDLMDEGAWQLFGRATASKGVRSTLTLPVMEDGRVVGSVNLYGGSAEAFTGHHEALATIFHAWAAGAVTNADLSFATLREARRAPQLLREESTFQVAVGILVARDGLDTGVAQRRLRNAAERAGIDLYHVAQAVIEAHQRRDADDR